MIQFEQLVTIAGWVGGIGAILCAIVYVCSVALKFISKKWIDQQFDESLSAFKHAQQKEIEKLRFSINSLMDRKTKLHQREFEVLPEAWAKLVDAFGYALAVTSPFQSYADVDHMSQAQLEVFLEKENLQEWEKEEILRSEKKGDIYRSRISWRRLFEVRQKSVDFHVYFKKYGIFIEGTLYAKFQALDDLLWSEITSFEIAKEAREFGEARAYQKKVHDLPSKGQKMLDELEKDIQAYFWNSKIT